MLTLMSEHWMDHAACRRTDPELFFPISEDGPALGQAVTAKSICATCPVVRECLAFALKTGQPAGIWGGRTVDERRALRQPATTGGWAQ